MLSAIAPTTTLAIVTKVFRFIDNAFRELSFLGFLRAQAPNDVGFLGPAQHCMRMRWRPGIQIPGVMSTAPPQPQSCHAHRFSLMLDIREKGGRDVTPCPDKD